LIAINTIFDYLVVVYFFGANIKADKYHVDTYRRRRYASICICSEILSYRTVRRSDTDLVGTGVLQHTVHRSS